MLRDKKTIWLTCALGVVLSGCTTAKNYSDTPAPSVNYDRYYGQPQTKHANDANNDTYTSTIPNDEADMSSRSALELNPNAPEQYVVLKGDTLWDIAGKFLKHPWRWPEIWDNNKDIKNPHLIYPGDTIRLENGVLSYNGKTAGSVPTSNDNSGMFKLKPRIRIERSANNAPESVNALAPFNVWPQVFDQADLNNAPYLLASQDDNLLITQGQKVYIKNIGQAHVGQRWAVYHPNKRLTDPQTGRMLGFEVTYGAEVEIEKIDNVTTAKVVSSSREIHSGDRLYAINEGDVYLDTPITYPNRKVRAEVISLFDATYLSGNYMVAVINQGKKQGMQLGYTLGAYAPGLVVKDPYRVHEDQAGIKKPESTQLPPEKVAHLIIFKVADEVSYGLIMDSSREVKTGYKIGNP